MADGRSIWFIDGSNLLAALGRHFGVRIAPERPHDDAIRLAEAVLNDLHGYLNQFSATRVLRRYWFGSFRCDDKGLEEKRRLLRECHFDPVVFKRTERKEKGVDIAVTRHMLVNAFQRNFEIGILVAGDADYRELVEEAKRYGSSIWVAFLDGSSLSPELRIAADNFYALPDAHSNSKDRMEKLVAAIKASGPPASEQKPCEECGGSGKVNW